MQKTIKPEEFLEFLDNYHHVIWDWNGTIIDDAQLCYQINAKLLAKYQITSFSYQSYVDNFQFPVKVFYQALGLDLSDSEFNSLNNDFLSEYYDESNIYGYPVFLRQKIIEKVESFYQK